MALARLLFFQEPKAALLDLDKRWFFLRASRCSIADLRCLNSAWNWWGFNCLKILQEPSKGTLKGVVIFPLAEIWNEILADFHRQVFSCVGVEALPIAENIHIY